MQTRQKIFKSTEPAEPADGEILPLNQRPEYQEPLKELQALEALHAEKERERKRLLARARGERTKRTPVELAKALLDGGRVDPVPAPDKIVAIDEELLILRKAIGEKTIQLDKIASEIAVAESLKAQPEFLERINAMHVKLRAARDEYEAAVAIPTRMHKAGLRASSVYLPEVVSTTLRGVWAFELPEIERRIAALESGR